MKRPDIQCNNHPDHPLLSVIIPSYNSEEFLEDCLESIEREVHPEVEVILVDGSSTDRTMEIVGQHAALFSDCLSEVDRGQSDAINKGFQLAKGKYLTWLNSDDMIVPGSMRIILNYLKHGESEWFAANSIYIDADSRVMKCCRSGKFEQFSMRYGLLNTFGPSTIFSRDLYERTGEIDVSYDYCMDTEYWWRLATSGVRYIRIPYYFWALRLHENAKTAASVTGKFSDRPDGMNIENQRMLERYYPGRTENKLRVGKFLARLNRTVKGTYPRALLDTVLNRGRRLDQARHIHWRAFNP